MNLGQRASDQQLDLFLSRRDFRVRAITRQVLDQISQIDQTVTVESQREYQHQLSQSNDEDRRHVVIRAKVQKKFL